MCIRDTITPASAVKSIFPPSKTAQIEIIREWLPLYTTDAYIGDVARSAGMTVPMVFRLLEEAADAGVIGVRAHCHEHGIEYYPLGAAEVDHD
jgi:hypothetical protein